MLRGEFHKSLPLLLTGQQLSVLRSLVYYSSSTHFLFETGIRLTRYGRFVNEILTMHRAKSYCSLRSQQHASRCTEFMLHCFRQPFRLHKEEFVSYSGFSILSMRYPIPMCVWIYCTPFFSSSSFFRSVAIKTLREATSFSEQRPQIC